MFISKGYSASSYFDGSVDEVEISTVARSADWIKTQYNNQNSPTSFLSVAVAVEVLRDGMAHRLPAKAVLQLGLSCGCADERRLERG